MNIKRLVLYLILLVCITVLWTSWDQEHRHAGIQHVHKYHRLATEDTGAFQVGVNKSLPAPKDRLVTVSTDVLTVMIDKLGGSIVSAKLLQYPLSLKQPHVPIKILDNTRENFYVAESGVLSEGAPQYHHPLLFKTKLNRYTLGAGKESLQVHLTGMTKAGLVVSKVFDFKPGHYAVGVRMSLKNAARKPWKGQFYARLRQRKPAQKSKRLFAFNTYQGPALYTPDKPYKKLSYHAMETSDYQRTIEGGWAAIQQHYFLSAWVPDASHRYHYYSHVGDDGIYTIGLLGPEVTVLPRSSYDHQSMLYIGPESIERLKPLSPGLDHTVDYGWLWFVSLMIFWIMRYIYQFVGNWGWSIILVTFLIKLAFLKLSETSYRSMAKMKNLQPRLKQIQAQYGNDRQALSQATMALYRKEKVNPLGGCLPFLVQIPIFIALYYVLMESVELRQAPFIFWIKDLSVKDPFYILPVLMGVSMWLQQRLNPTPSDPIQAKMMWLLPVVFTVLFASFSFRISTILVS